MNLCVICLHTDELLKNMSNTLEEFYFDLCEIPLAKISTTHSYCNDCEYELKKFYKFKQNCIKAQKVHYRWMSALENTKKSSSEVEQKYCDQNCRKNDIKFVDVPKNKSSDHVVKIKDFDEIKNHLEREGCLVDTHAYSETIEVTNKVMSSKSKSNETVKKLSYSDRFTEKDGDFYDVNDSIDLSFTEKANIKSYIHSKETNYDKLTKNDKEYKSVESAFDTDGDIKGIKLANENAYAKSRYCKETDQNYDKFKVNEEDSNFSVATDNKTSLNSERHLVSNYNKYKRKVKRYVLDDKESMVDSNKNTNSKLKCKEIVQKPLYYDKLKQNDKYNPKFKINDDNESIKVINKKIPPKSNNTEETIQKPSYYDKFKEYDKKYDSVFDIEYLTTEEQKIEEFQKRKTYKCYVSAEYKCNICYQGFKSEKFLEYHISKKHMERPDRRCCPICKIWYSKTKKSNHKFTHTMVFRCKLCPLITYYRSSMHVHYELHKGKIYECEQCNIKCKSKASYLSHLGKVHRLGRHVCAGCGRGFRSPRGLRIHRDTNTRCGAGGGDGSSLEGGSGVRCGECHVTFASQQIYDTHMYDVHSAPVFTRQGTTESAKSSKHIMLNNDVTLKPRVRKKTKITCRVCNKEGLSFYWLQQHFKREHPTDDIDVLYADKKPHLCEVCGAGFCNVYALRDHKNCHTGARPHACDLCPKKFHSGSKMREHRLRHFPPTVPCERCGKRFKTKANLYTHMMTHSGEKNNKCDICEKCFVQRSSLNEHIRGVHYNIKRIRGGKEGGGMGGKTKKGRVLPIDLEMDFGVDS